jgi:hypothetical protein
VANAPEQRVSVKLFQAVAKIFFAWVQVSDGPNNDGVLRGDVQNPLVVL